VRSRRLTYQANPVATMSIPVRFSGLRYQAKSPAPTKPGPITRSARIQTPRSVPKSAVAMT
jgi:hypothetical protein